MPSDMKLFTAREHEVLLATERAKLEQLSEDELADLLPRVRRLRNKYSDLHRRQGKKSVEGAGKRYAATTSNERTLKKAEILEDRLSRVARYLSRAARASANELKDQRLAAARKARASGPKRSSKPRPAKRGSKPGSKRRRKAKRSEPIVSGGRVGRTSAKTKRRQASRDRRTTSSRKRTK